MSYFRLREYEIRAGFGPASSTKIKFLQFFKNTYFWGWFSIFYVQNKYKTCVSVHFRIHTKKLITIKVRELKSTFEGKIRLKTHNRDSPLLDLCIRTLLTVRPLNMSQLFCCTTFCKSCRHPRKPDQGSIDGNSLPI